MKKYAVALDQGTTSSRTIVFDKNLNAVKISQKEYPQIFPKPGCVEHDPDDIWASQLKTLNDAVNGIDLNEIACIGITNQRETTVLWEKATGKPVCNAIVWQCRRTADICEKLKEDGYTEMIRKKTGLVIDAYFSATKIKWLLDNTPGLKDRARNGEILFGTVDSWLLYNLTGEHKTDYTNACRTMLFNIHTLTWDDELLALLDIPKCMLPKAVSSSEIYGYYEKDGVKIPISGIAGDQQAALFGQRCFEKGDAKNTYGTGCFMLVNTGTTPPENQGNLLATVGIGVKGHIRYCLEGSVFAGGAVIKWLRDQLGIINSASETEALAMQVEDTGGVYFVPAFTGLGAPYWDMHARAGMLGITRGTNKCHIVRAALESMTYQVNDLIDEVRNTSGVALSSLKVDGGASRNNLLMQFQSDISSLPVIRPENTETTALGAAMLAGMAVGFYEFPFAGCEKADTFAPQMDENKRKALLSGWAQAVERVKSK